MKVHHIKKYKKIKSATKSYNQITKNNFALSVEDSIKHAVGFEISDKMPIAKSSDFNEVLLPFPESDARLKRSYQVKHKIDEVVDFQVDSKNNKGAVKKQMPNIDVNFVEKKVNNERTEKTLSVEKHVFIVEENVIKHVNGYKISGKLENSKAYVRPCHGATIRCLKDRFHGIHRNEQSTISKTEQRYSRGHY